MSSAPFRDRFLRACRLQPVDRTPVWFMRQAGRYLPEYRELRGDRDILETCRDPAQVVEITLQPLRRMDLDAAIVFSDIMVPLAGIGIDVRIEPGRGPVVGSPIRSAADVDRLRPLEPVQDVPEALEAIRLLRKELSVPLIGFAGAPFTLASYLIEGGPSRSHERTKALMHGDHVTWDALMRALVAIVAPHLRAQVEAGAQALQVFDSWVGVLDRDDYRRRVQPHMSSLFAKLADLGVPVIHFGVGTGELLGEMAVSGGNVIGVDWRVPLDEAWDRVGHDRAVQGNLDPAVLGLRGRSSNARPSRCCGVRVAATATSSTSATACSPTPRPTRSPASPTSCIRKAKEAHVSGSPPIGVLVMAYGTAAGPDDIERYYTDIRGGRPPTPEHLQELRDRYEAIGNVFPLGETTRGAGQGLVDRLNADADGNGYRAYLGMKHSPPFIPDGVDSMRADGIERGIGIVMAPHWSGMSVETYIERVQQAVEDHGEAPAFTFVPQLPRPPGVHRVPVGPCA